MKNVVLRRLDCGDQGCFGRITAGDLTLFTGELPWRENIPNKSCIPKGVYECAWTWSPRFKRFMYLVQGVAGRSGIRIHPANLMGDAKLGYRAQLNGCISIGERMGWLDGQKAVLISRTAVHRFEFHMGYKPFRLEVS